MGCLWNTFLIWLSIFSLFYVFRQRWVYPFLIMINCFSMGVFNCIMAVDYWSFVIALSLIWSVDIAQYCVGRCVGHYPLCQSISPNKNYRRSCSWMRLLDWLAMVANSRTICCYWGDCW